MWSFVKLAKKWPKLMMHWEKFETTTAIRNREVHMQMRRLIKSSSVGIPLLSLFEHLLSLANNVNTATMCKFTNDPMEAYFKQAFPQFYAFFNVNYLNGIFLQILNLFCTFMWNYLDNFIVLISLGLITQFRHFNSYLHSCKGKVSCIGFEFVVADSQWVTDGVIGNGFMKSIKCATETHYIITKTYFKEINKEAKKSTNERHLKF